MIASYKAVFFDAGGTLFRPFPSVGEIYQKVAERYGCTTHAERLEEIFRRAWLKRDGMAALVIRSDEKIEREWWRSLVHEVFSEVGGVRNFESFFAELYDLFASPAAWQLYPSTLEVLQELKRKKKRIGVISNWDSRLFKLCEGLGLMEYFEFVLASAVFGAAKPSPKIFQEALRCAGVEPQEAVHIGDSFEDDIQGAHAVGIEAILIDRHPGGRSLPQVRAIRDLRELLA